MKKILRISILTSLLLLACSAVAFAASCTCGYDAAKGVTSYHDDFAHNTYYEPGMTVGTEPVLHIKYCKTCSDKGHGLRCDLVMLGNENHTFSYVGKGESRIKKCYTCGYQEAAPCTHDDAVWKNRVETTSTKCVKYCGDCAKVVETKNHRWEYTQRTDSDKDEYHRMKCLDCGYLDSYMKHTFTTTYTAYSTPKDPIGRISSMVWPARDHKVVHTCATCGYSWQEGITTYNNTVGHTFKNDVCTLCGLKRTILPKVKGTSGKQKGSTKVTTVKTKACWVWTGSRFYWHPAGSYKKYTYKVTVRWKKNADAFGYIVTAAAPKTGDYINETTENSTNYSIVKKTNYTYTLTSTKKLSRVKVYIAPISKYGYIGKVKAVTVKVR